MSFTPKRTTIEVNGFAYREIRIRSGIDIAPCAESAGISRPYLARLELGARVRVSPPVFQNLLRALQITDRRAILANPHGEAIDLDEQDEAKSA
jgi:transcriptional regulator with XRE-family HTH domain